MRRLRPLKQDRGSMAVEFVIAAPLLVVLLLLVSGGGEWLNLAGNVTAAARDAVRAASLARTDQAAKTAATAAAAADLSNVTCAAPGPMAQVQLYRGGQVDGDFATAQDIEVTVTCQASLNIYRDIIGFRVSHTFTDTAVAPLDPFVDRG